MLPVIAQPAAEHRAARERRACAGGRAIAGFKVRQDRIKQALDRTRFVTALNPVIGYEKGAAIAKRAYAEGRPVRDVALEMTDWRRTQLKRICSIRRL